MASKYMKHLETSLTKDEQNLHIKNYAVLLKKIKENKQGAIPCSLIERFNTAKISVPFLYQLIYRFNTNPIKIFLQKLIC